MKRLIIILTLSFLISAAFASAEGEVEKSAVKAENAKLELPIKLDVKVEPLDIAKYEVVDANVLELENAIPVDTKNAFSEELSYPQDCRENSDSEMVWVSFTYDEDGYIKVLSSNASNCKLNEYIEKKLEDIRLKNGIIVIGKEYYAKFHFKLL